MAFHARVGALFVAVAGCSAPNPWFGALDSRPGPETDGGATTTTADSTGPGTTAGVPTDGSAEASASTSTTDVSTTDEATTDVSTTDDPTVPMPVCGDHKVDPDEQCDDGNGDDNDDCLSTCLNAFCGDGVKWEGVELCDDGNNVDDDGCTGSCAPPTCGDGELDPGEECDDGNPTNEDDCSNLCIVATCGDNVEQDGEQCDDGNQVDTDACVNCKNAVCGDGFVNANEEQCDDQNDNNGDACPSTCLNARCGDGFLYDNKEECDDGNNNNTDNCSIACTKSKCGDGVIQGDETCDDGPFGNTSGCTPGCAVSLSADCGNGEIDDGEECDGMAEPFNLYPGMCSPTCRMNGCLRIVNTDSPDLGFKFNDWLTPCTGKPGTTVVIALFNPTSDLVYMAHGPRPGPTWTPTSLTAGNLNKGLEYDVGMHMNPVPQTSVKPAGKSGALMLTSMVAEPEQYSCFTSLGDGYGLALFADVNQPQATRLLVMGHKGGQTGNTRLMEGWSPAAEISYTGGELMDVCLGPDSLKPFLGKFVMAIF